MKKSVIAIVLFAIVIATAACSGSSDKSAEALYKSYVQNYGYVAESLGATPDETFTEYASNLSAEDCEHIDGEGVAMISVLVGSTLQSHGDDVAGFVRATNELTDAAKAEGFCKDAPETTTTTEYVAPTTTTTVPDTSELEAMCWKQWNDLNALESRWSALSSSAELVGGESLATWKNQGRDIAGLYRSGAAACSGILPATTVDSMKEIAGLVEDLINLY